MSEHRPDWVYLEALGDCPPIKWCKNCRYTFPVDWPEEFCRCRWCARCDKLVESYQGHSWYYCKVTKTKREFHFCCPDDCELESK